MKRKIDTIKGKRLVVGGGTNTLSKNEILVTETTNGIELKERGEDGSVKQLTNSSDFIYVGLKNPINRSDSIPNIVDVLVNDYPSIMKLSHDSYDFFGIYFGRYDITGQHLLGVGIPKIPQFPITDSADMFIFRTFEDLMSALIVDYGFSPDDVYSNFYEITKEEFFTPFGEYTDILTLQIDDKELIVDFASRKWFLTGEGWKDINSDDNRVSVVGLLRLPYHYEQMVYNNVKYETTTNNYVVYGCYDGHGGYVFTDSRLKTNGVGPDPNYPKLDGAVAFMHSSGIQVEVIL